ncbi:N-acetyl sugar amidotransferase [Flavihumibacter petaseus]|uniref:Putative polysaccharide biosynthesis protein n=1 Tax=Flavihumibacter petaseus NBRC 106054 TaxID=1220578 RepID=A0A0E9N5X1_9BACT|nr:N-acetyl sugar amidotransferase [Flavihumibacter petaseus]GAO45219.1 putative polysaccharide biosynthesis protein [Flavihumibacter petaseus NBRC 106054]
MSIEFRQCAVSVLDNIADPDIIFDEQGISNYYYEYKAAEKERVIQGKEGWDQLEAIAAEIKQAGKDLPYDCIMGLSGGVDSTYVAYIAKKLGLRPLAVHFDNGWNSELAVQNIENIVNKLGFDLFTYVIDWEEFKDLQLSYLKASVVDIEAITDHAIFATLYRLAGEKNIRYLLNGTNVQTEQTLPKSWVHPKADHINIKAIHKVYGKVPLKTFPFMDTKVKRYYQQVKGVRSVSILNYVDYNKKAVKALIQEELGWRDYGGKHYESVWTRFYQGYILPVKFKIDKRKAHLSDLIFGGQITKEEAVEELKKPIYDPEQLKIDYEFVLKKLSLTREAFDQLMKEAPRSHYEFDHEMPIDKRYPILKPVKQLYRKMFPLKK